MKIILSILFLSMLASCSSYTHKETRVPAAAGLATANPAVAIKGLALLGTSAILFPVFEYGRVDHMGVPFWGGVIGLIMLDGENGQELQFKKLTAKEVAKLKLTKEEAFVYNNNTEELSHAFKMVSRQLNDKSTPEQAKKLWEEQESIFGSDAINALIKVLNQEVKEE
jgi:hypothetical protein